MSVNTAAEHVPVLPRLITIRDVAEALAVSRQTIYNLIARKELTAVKIGSGLRFKLDDVLAYIERQSRGHAS
jgi:excisionase family DNA binding protein